MSRLLSTLERRGLVEQDRETGHFHLGVGIIRLAQCAERTLDLRTIAADDLDRLYKATRETVSLEVFDGVGASVAICQIDGPNLSPMPDITGRPPARWSVTLPEPTGAQNLRLAEREVMLQKLDQHWREHLAGMEYLGKDASYPMNDVHAENVRFTWEALANGDVPAR